MEDATTFDPRSLPGINFFDGQTKRNMRYIYPDADSWMAGWIVTQNASGHWMTWRKATETDITAINGAVVRSHHEQA